MSEKVLLGVTPLERHDVEREEFFMDDLPPVTVESTAGNDSLTGTYSEDTFIYRGGNDTIINYSGEDTVSIASGTLGSYSFSGNDLVFKVGSGSITLQGMKGRAITVTDSKGTSTKVYGTGYSGQDAIKNFVKSMSQSLVYGKTRLDEAVRASSHFNSMQEVVDQMVADCRKVGDAQTFIRDYCGIITNNKDNGSATGWDAGGEKVKTSNDLYTTVADAKYPDSTTFTIRGLTVTVPEKSTLNEKEQLVVKAFYSWWAEDAIKLIEESYGMHFDGQKINFQFMNDSTDYGSAYGGASLIKINMAYNSGITESNMRTYISSTLAHEMTHVMQGNFGIMSYATSYMTEGMADLTRGGDRYALADDPDKLAYILDLDNEVSWIDNPTDYNYMYPVGYMFWRYFMKQAADNYDSKKTYAWSDGANIKGTSGAEFLTASGNKATITAGAGNDTVTSYGEKAKVQGGDGNDTIAVVGDYSTIEGGTGNDSIRNSGSNVTINTGAGDDTVNNTGSKVTIDGGAGTDNIYNSAEGTNSSINGGADNDTINNNAAQVTIQSGAGDDIVNNYGSQVTIDGGDGNDKIYNRSTTKYVDGYYETVYPENVTVTGGKGDDTLYNYGSKVTILGGDGIDSIYSHSLASGVSIDGGAGTDRISNYSAKTTILGGADADTIWNYAENVTIDAGDGNDYIMNSGGANLYVEYSGGNDYISGADSTTTLKIAGDFTSVVSGSNLILTVGSDKITLAGAANKGITVEDSSVDKRWTLNGTTATYGTTTETLITVKGVKSANNFKVSGREVTIPQAALGTAKVTINNGYTLALADDVPVPTGDTPTLIIGKNKTSATINQSLSAGYVLSADKKSITYANAATGKKVATISGLKKNFAASDLTLNTSAKTVTISANALGTGKISIDKNGEWSLRLTSGLSPIIYSPTWKIASTSATLQQKTGAGYTLAADGKSIAYSKEKTVNLTTISGLKKNFSESDISRSGTTVTLSANALGTSNVKATNGYTLALASGIPTSGTTTYDWTVSKGKGTYKETTSAYYTLANDKKSVKYTKEKSGATLATISGMNTAATKSDIKVSGEMITLSENALIADAKKKITLTNAKGKSYRFVLDSSLTTGTQKPLWVVEKSTATYGWGTTAHYNVTDNKITYAAETPIAGLEDIILSNLNSKALTPDANGNIEGISLSAITATLSANVLNKKEVKLTGAKASNYRLLLAGDVEKSTVSVTTWTHKGTTDTLFEIHSKGYYTDGDHSIKYRSKETSTTLATVKGTKRELTSSGDTITLSDADLAANHKVTISGTKKFSFAADYSDATITGGKDNDTLTVAGDCVSINTGAGDDSISVTGAGASIKAGKGDDYIYLGGGSAVVFFASGEGNDVIANFKATDKLKITSGTVTATNSGSDVLVTVKKGKVTETITLQGAASQTFSIYDGKEKILYTHSAVATSADLLYDTNYDTAAQLGDLISPATDYSLGDLNVSTDTLTQDKTQLTYGTKK